VRGAWRPGGRIPSENDLAEGMGVSRVSVREGLQMLVTLGLLETRHGEGTFVREFTGEAYMNGLFPVLALGKTGLFHVLEYRRIMEKGAAAIVAERATEETVRGLEACYATMEACRGDNNAFAIADLDFHLFLAKATGNPLIIKVTDIIRSILTVSMESIVLALGVEDGLIYHKKIIGAIKARDPALAERLMEEHVDRTIRRLRDETDLMGARKEARPRKAAAAKKTGG
jgi:GntR family transcriptional regulator, transcriptional repressor for pyruvate dehydrogenase complex